MKPSVTLATDASLRRKKKVGAWAAVYRCGDRLWSLSGQVHSAQSIQQLELLAVREGLRGLQRPCNVTLVTDDRGIKDVIEGGRVPEKLSGLWLEMLRAALPHAVTVQWVKGHSGHPLNEHAHSLAHLTARLKGGDKQSKGKGRAAPGLVAGPLNGARALHEARVVLNAEPQGWSAALSGPHGERTYHGPAEGTMHHQLFRALHEVVEHLPPRTALEVHSRERTLEACWRSRNPSKGYREVLHSLRTQVGVGEHELVFAPPGLAAD